MMYVLLTLSITVGILLASGIATAIMLHPKVMKKFMEYSVNKAMEMSNLVVENEEEL